MYVCNVYICVHEVPQSLNWRIDIIIVNINIYMGNRYTRILYIDRYIGFTSVFDCASHVLDTFDIYKSVCVCVNIYIYMYVLRARICSQSGNKAIFVQN